VSDEIWATLDEELRHQLSRRAVQNLSIAQDALHRALHPGDEVRASPLPNAAEEVLEQALNAALAAENIIIGLDANGIWPA
jgi:hypothetical protein